MSKPEKGFFAEEVEGEVFIHPKVFDEMVEKMGKHIDWVDEHGPKDECVCPYCKEVREKMSRKDFEELYGEEDEKG